MKIDRLMGILSVLLQQKRITAPKLAEKFEVSIRTINRDIESLCKAGIPIQTIQGCGGGIQIMEGYKIDQTLLSSKDMQVILAGLRSLDSVSGSNYYGQLMEKLEVGSSNFISGKDSILIDLSSWDKESLSPKITIILEAIENRRYLLFDYYAPTGNSIRRMEPYFLIFKWSSWYVWGWCKKRNDFRMFKLNRMDRLRKDDKSFVRREVCMPDLEVEKRFPGKIHVKAIFERQVEWRLVEEFGPHGFVETEEGKLLFEADYTNKDNLIEWLLTFGDNVVLLEPVQIKEEIRNLLRKMQYNFDNS